MKVLHPPATVRTTCPEELKAISTTTNAYLAHIRNPKDRARYDAFGDALAELVLIMLPDDRLRGKLRGEEADIRQSALAKLTSTYLAGNPKLRRAVASGNATAAAAHVHRSVANCLRNTIKQAADKAKLQSKYFVPLPDDVVGLAEETENSNALEYEMRKQLEQYLDSAESDQSLSEMESRLLRLLVVDEQTRKDVGDELGWSASKISKTLKEISEKLTKSLKRPEPEM